MPKFCVTVVCVRTLQEQFETQDKNGDGRVTMEELLAGVPAHRCPGVLLVWNMCITYIHCIKGPVSRSVCIDAGLDAVRPLGAKDSWSREIKAVYHKTFERADANQDGELTLRERVLGFVSVDGEAADDAVQMMRIFDDNGDGVRH